ncbi:histone 24-like [Gigantopelta aegis]|uniref:histone 24-like n=1 Tax=Gigantopelta aegis TaxID=1735272 RepID=UPI001B8875B9|nr:histone 24-like [Gigantopelta aegis]
MADVAQVQKTPKKKATKPKKVSSHPKYNEMIKAAIAALKDRHGSSRQAILSYIVKHYKVADEKTVNSHLKLALRAGVKNKSLKQSKGTGASGSFRLGELKAKKAPKAKKPKAAKPKKAKKPKAATKPKVKKPKTKKSPKKVSKPKTAKAAKPKKPKTPKKTKSPKKKAAKKPAKK